MLTPSMYTLHMLLDVPTPRHASTRARDAVMRGHCLRALMALAPIEAMLGRTYWLDESSRAYWFFKGADIAAKEGRPDGAD